MLERLLAEIYSGGTLETGALAARLGTTPQLIEAMLSHLERSGLIQVYPSCQDGCLGCSLRDACQRLEPGAIRIWQSKPGC
jgi:DNA-binding MarR family transcriptional regulator